MTDGLKDKIANSLHEVVVGRMLRSRLAETMLTAIEEAGYVVVKRIDHATPNAETVEVMSECHPWYGPCDALLPDGGCAECLKASRIRVPAGYISVGSSDERRKLADRIAGLAHGAVLVESERDLIVAALRAEKSGPITTEQLDKLQFGKVLHERPARSYADLSDSATTFNPEEQFEKDNGL